MSIKAYGQIFGSLSNTVRYTSGRNSVSVSKFKLSPYLLICKTSEINRLCKCGSQFSISTSSQLKS